MNEIADRASLPSQSPDVVRIIFRCGRKTVTIDMETLTDSGISTDMVRCCDYPNARSYAGATLDKLRQY